MACAFHDIASAEHHEASRNYGNFAHETKNSAIATANLLFPDRHHSLATKLAYHSTRILAATAFLSQHIAPGGAGIAFTPDSQYATVVKSSIEFLLYIQALRLHLDPQSEVELYYSYLPHPQGIPQPIAAELPLDSDFEADIRSFKIPVICALALLREVVGNIRNRYPAFSRQSIQVTYGVDQGPTTVAATICQETYERHRPGQGDNTKKDNTKKLGIQRANELFLDIGKVTFDEPCVKEETAECFHVVRNYRVEWKGGV